MLRPRFRSSYGNRNRKRTAKDRRDALVNRLGFCREELLPTFTPEQLAEESGVPVGECARLLKQAMARVPMLAAEKARRRR